MKKITTIPTIIGIFFLAASVMAGVILVQRTQTFSSGASGSSSPREVKISNASDTSFVISWITDTPSSGFVKYGTNQNSLNQTAIDDFEKSITHYTIVKNLAPGTEYFFKINSDNTDYDSNGIPWSAKTGTTIGSPESIILISGKVETENGAPSSGSLVFANIPGGTAQSAKTGSEGGWIITLSLSRSATLNSYATIDISNTIVDLLVQGSDGNLSTAKVTPEIGRNTPTIVLGQVHDFTNTITNPDQNVGEAVLEVPNSITNEKSKFTIEDNISTPSAETVTLDSHDNGETITTESPEFFGEGPPGSDLTITIESDPVTQSINVDSSGNWKWSPPVNLAPGEHTLTIAWRDAQGILRKLTRSFVVSAAEVTPAFESTPSATLSPTPTASATPTIAPTASPSSTPTASGSAVPIPVTGTLTPTLVLSIMGIGLVLFAGVLALIAF